MSQLRVILLQESLNGSARTILALLREKMDAVDGIRRRRRSLKERLGLKGMSCCGATWGFRPNTINLSDGEDEAEEYHHDQHQQQPEQQETNPGQDRPDNMPGPDCVRLVPVISGGGMNLAAALAAERHIRAADGTNNVVGPTSGSGNNNNGDNVDPAGTAPGTPLRVSLMRLLAEADGCGDGEVKAEAGVGVGNDMMCCVCMGRKKGAAFIPCGHTFCRVCSRELWLNRGSCPLCNRSILEILDIF